MKRAYIILSFILIPTLFLCCKKNSPTEPVNETIDSNALANNLLAWSTNQPSPFVIFGKGDTTGGHATESSDLITNIIPYPQDWRFGTCLDSLFVDSIGLQILKTTMSQLPSNAFLKSFRLSMSEQDMIPLLNGLGLRLRMMVYDSLTSELEVRLIAWSYHHNPHQTIHTGLYYFVHEGPYTIGGYRLPWFTFRAVQNLQYYTRKVDRNTLGNIVASVDTSLTVQQLQVLFSPISLLEFHDTIYEP